jgi:hypothetical protein
MKLALSILTCSLVPIVAVGCFTLPNENPKYQKEPPANGLRTAVCDFDFRNFSFPSPFEIGKVIELENGESLPERAADGLIKTMGYRLVALFEGDLTGDDRPEAIVVLGVLTGGSAAPHAIYVIDTSTKTPSFLWSFATGDRADGGLRNIRVSNRELVLEVYEPSDAGDCCPKTYSSTRYRWAGNTFELIHRTGGLPNDKRSAIFFGTLPDCQLPRR